MLVHSKISGCFLLYKRARLKVVLVNHLWNPAHNCSDTNSWNDELASSYIRSSFTICFPSDLRHVQNRAVLFHPCHITGGRLGSLAESFLPLNRLQSTLALQFFLRRQSSNEDDAFYWLFVFNLTGELDGNGALHFLQTKFASNRSDSI